jgi:hypothetical protein
LFPVFWFGLAVFHWFVGVIVFGGWWGWVYGFLASTARDNAENKSFISLFYFLNFFDHLATAFLLLL